MREPYVYELGSVDLDSYTVWLANSSLIKNAPRIAMVIPLPSLQKPLTYGRSG